MDINQFWPCELNLGVCDIFFQNFKLSNNFWTVSARALIFHMSISLPIPTFLTLLPWPWSLTYFLKILTLLITARALIFHMSYYCDKTFSYVPTVCILYPWPLSFAYIFKTLTLWISFDQCVLKLCYFNGVFIVTTEDFSVSTNIFPYDLDLWVFAYFLKTLKILLTFEQWMLKLWYFILIFLVIRSFCWFLTWPWNLTFLKRNWH